MLACLVWSRPVGTRAEQATDPGTLGSTLEVIEVLKSRYVDRDKLDAQTLNEATTKGLLNALGQGVMIVTPPPAQTNTPAAAEETLPLARAEIINPEIGYIRIGDLMPETVPALDAELKKFGAAKVTGYVLDLRFADGTNHTVASSIASRFLNEGLELFTLKANEGATQSFRSTKPAEVADLKNLTEAPLMVLVNSQTRGSAEVLAGSLQAQDRAVVIGGRTAGAAAAWDEVKLRDGRLLRIATAKILLPDRREKGAMTASVFPGGVTPDVPVKMDAKVERSLFFGAQTNLTLAASVEAKEIKKRMGEADLVKAFRGEAVDLKTPGTKDDSDAEPTMGPDAVLQRAVDILKGIRVLLSWQSPQ